jgi:hypothetical protein
MTAIRSLFLVGAKIDGIYIYDKWDWSAWYLVRFSIAIGK